MVEVPNNLACLQDGANPKYIALHAKLNKISNFSSNTNMGYLPKTTETALNTHGMV